MRRENSLLMGLVPGSVRTRWTTTDASHPSSSASSWSVGCALAWGVCLALAAAPSSAQDATVVEEATPSSTEAETAEKSETEAATETTEPAAVASEATSTDATASTAEQEAQEAETTGATPTTEPGMEPATETASDPASSSETAPAPAATETEPSTATAAEPTGAEPTGAEPTATQPERRPATAGDEAPSLSNNFTFPFSATLDDASTGANGDALLYVGPAVGAGVFTVVAGALFTTAAVAQVSLDDTPAKQSVVLPAVVGGVVHASGAVLCAAVSAGAAWWSWSTSEDTDSSWRDLELDEPAASTSGAPGDAVESPAAADAPASAAPKEPLLGDTETTEPTPNNAQKAEEAGGGDTVEQRDTSSPPPAAEDEALEKTSASESATSLSEEQQPAENHKEQPQNPESPASNKDGDAAKSPGADLSSAEVQPQ